MNQLFLPGVNVVEIAQALSRNNQPVLWLPEKHLVVKSKEVLLDSRKLDSEDKLLTRPEKLDCICLLCQDSENCQHFLPSEVGCFWCRRKFSEESIGIPFRWDTVRRENKQIKRVFMYGKYCSYNCAYADLCDSLSKNNQKKTIFSQSESLLKHLFNCTYPGKILQSAPHWTLLDINGGPLSVEKFTDNYFSYQSIPNYFRIGIELEFIRKINQLHNDE